MNPVKFLRETLSELKQVSWPSRQTTIRLTIIVIVLSLATGVYVGGLDYLFTNILKLLIG
jgi:preprotein translocase subunit SecE